MSHWIRPCLFRYIQVGNHSQSSRTGLSVKRSTLTFFFVSTSLIFLFWLMNIFLNWKIFVMRAYPRNLEVITDIYSLLFIKFRDWMKSFQFQVVWRNVRDLHPIQNEWSKWVLISEAWYLSKVLYLWLFMSLWIENSTMFLDLKTHSEGVHFWRIKIRSRLGVDTKPERNFFRE